MNSQVILRRANKCPVAVRRLRTVQKHRHMIGALFAVVDVLPTQIPISFSEAVHIFLHRMIQLMTDRKVILERKKIKLIGNISVHENLT